MSQNSKSACPFSGMLTRFGGLGGIQVCAIRLATGPEKRSSEPNQIKTESLSMVLLSDNVWLLHFASLAVFWQPA